MTTPQILAFGIIAAMMVAFVLGRWRYDVVAVGALLAAVTVGVVKPTEAFKGFSDDIVIIVGSALVVSAAVARTGIMEMAVRRFAPNISTPRAQLILLVLTVTVLSAFIKNIGALAIMMPIAFQMARKSGVSPSLFLMPMSFGSLLGGLMTQIGTSPNIIVSRVRQDLTGVPFTMFDFTPVGAALALVGLVFLAFCYKLLPARTRDTSSMDQAIEIKNYTTEAHVPAQSSAVGMTIGELQRLGGGAAMIIGIIGESGARRKPLPDSIIKEGDVLLLEGAPEALDTMVAQGKLTFSKRRDTKATSDNTGIVEAVVTKTSDLIGRSAQELSLFDRTGLNLLAVSRRDKRFTERLGQIRFQNGDVIVLQGDLKELPDLLRRWNCLPLVERGLKLGSVRNGLVPLLILAAAMATTALGLIPVAIAFFAAAVLMVVSRALPLREVYSHLDAPILIMLAALIPISDSLRTTGGTDVISSWLSQAASVLPAYGALALIMVAAMAVTPFLNNAATVLVMAPIAATFATDLGFQPEAFLMAVAIGAGSDFLTPIGHQCNTLVMGPGGYRFGDYWRLGLPLSILVVLVAVPMLLLVWAL
ncbi:permease [Devosia limi DSM 17137]|uniref:Di-and tricarboxylate transporter n=1 Tax=Devosia limi DSM 17137 TaxID=1121477 RepID=A0A0F5LED3_9HYPH|nr:SLC13 family permease [Devosia limi]KKB80713.1 permease [Devosia limi DSM 17137]SHE51409.1 Di-and tricarboxylate transporter [Devosia limi DSM 17137]